MFRFGWFFVELYGWEKLVGSFDLVYCSICIYVWDNLDIEVSSFQCRFVVDFEYFVVVGIIVGENVFSVFVFCCLQLLDVDC